MKKAFIISAIFIVIIVVVSIIISINNLKPITFKRVVCYDEKLNIITEVPKHNTTTTNDDFQFFSNILKYEKTIMVSTIFLVLIFGILFYGTKRSKGW